MRLLLSVSYLLGVIASGLRGTIIRRHEGGPEISMEALNLWIDGKEIEKFVGRFCFLFLF